MPKNEEKNEEKSEKKVSNETAYQLRKLTHQLDALIDAFKMVAATHYGKEVVRNLEIKLGVDINKDGKVGSFRMAGMFCLALLSFVCMTIAAVNTNVVDWKSEKFSPNAVGKIVYNSADSNLTLSIDRIVLNGSVITPTNTITGNADYGGNLTVVGEMKVSGETHIGLGTNKVVILTNGNTSVAGTLGVTGVATLAASPVFTAGITGPLNIGQDTNKVTIATNGNTKVAGTLTVTGTLGASGAATVGTTLGVTGVSTLSSNVYIGSRAAALSIIVTNLPTAVAGLAPGRLWVSNNIIVVAP